jgi:hypothetical protein
MFVPLFESERNEERDPKSESDVIRAFVGHKTCSMTRLLTDWGTLARFHPGASN